MKFLIDMPLPPALAHWLASQGHDAVHASVAGLDRSTDAEILAQARQEARTLLTAISLALSGADGPSLILFRGDDWTEPDAIGRMQQILHAMSESEIERSIVVVDRSRLRRRRLPIT